MHSRKYYCKGCRLLSHLKYFSNRPRKTARLDITRSMFIVETKVRTPFLLLWSPLTMKNLPSSLFFSNPPKMIFPLNPPPPYSSPTSTTVFTTILLPYLDLVLYFPNNYVWCSYYYWFDYYYCLISIYTSSDSHVTKITLKMTIALVIEFYMHSTSFAFFLPH